MSLNGNDSMFGFLADIAALTRNNNGDNGLGGSGAWVLIILFALIFLRRGGGFFGGGEGGGGAGGACCAPASCADLQRGFDAQATQQRFNGIDGGLADAAYENARLIASVNDNVAQMGFSAINAMNQGFSGLYTGQVTQGYETRLANQATQAQINNCCCDIKELIQQDVTQGVMNTNAVQQQISQVSCNQEKEAMQTRYDMATMGCNLQNTMHNNTRDIIENDNANWRALDARLTQMEMAQKDNKIAEQAAMLASMQSKNDLLESSNYIVNRLNPPAVPSYTVPNPNCCYPTQQYRGCCNTGNNCGW